MDTAWTLRVSYELYFVSRKSDLLIAIIIFLPSFTIHTHNIWVWDMEGLWIYIQHLLLLCFNTLRPKQNGRYFADDIFKCIFFNENVWIPIKTSLKFVPKGPINNIPAVV